MQTTINHKGKNVVLDLTPEQEAILKASEKDIMSLIDSWEDIIKRASLDADEINLLNYQGVNPRMLSTKSELMNKIMCDVMNEGWVWQPGEQGWVPIFNCENGGFAFSCSYCGRWGSYSDVGSRRCLKSEKLSDFCAKKFPHIYKSIILNQ